MKDRIKRFILNTIARWMGMEVVADSQLKGAVNIKHEYQGRSTMRIIDHCINEKTGDQLNEKEVVKLMMDELGERAFTEMVMAGAVAIEVHDSDSTRKIEIRFDLFLQPKERMGIKWFKSKGGISVPQTLPIDKI